MSSWKHSDFDYYYHNCDPKVKASQKTEHQSSSSAILLILQWRPILIYSTENHKKKLQMPNTSWDFSEDPCSGKGSWNVSQEKSSANMVTCSCTLDGESFFRVTNVRLKSQNLSGVVPPEFANLTYLEELDLTRNYLNGSIPRELGSLVHLKNLTLGTNRLSGYIPKELGNLRNLTSLVVLSNNLSGQLAKLSNLEKLNIGSNQFSGPIPKCFSCFKVLKDFRADSNNFEGDFKPVPSRVQFHPPFQA